MSSTMMMRSLGHQDLQLAGYDVGGRIQYTHFRHAQCHGVRRHVRDRRAADLRATPVDMHIHDTYFIVGHIHYVLFGGSTFAIFAGITYWFPKMFGRLMDERLGKIHFILTFIFFNGTFFLMHIVGMHGHPRRIADPYVYDFLNNPSVRGMNIVMTYSAIGLGLAQLIFAFNFFYSLVAGPRASENPWHSNSLEWQTTPPLAHYNFETLPVVHHGPYEYSVPGVSSDYLVQTMPRSAIAGPVDPVMGDA
ncbi:MAG: cbb3-type cytochrome c oxidase subunit I [Isosphaeraceae bacterium]